MTTHGIISIDAVFWRAEHSGDHTSFLFQDGKGHTTFMVQVKDWAPNLPIIHNNADELAGRLVKGE